MGQGCIHQAPTCSVGCRHPCSTVYLSNNAYLGCTCQLPSARGGGLDGSLCNHRVPKYQTRIRSCNARARKTVYHAHNVSAMLFPHSSPYSRRGCDPPSLHGPSLFLSLKAGISQLVTCQPPPRHVPGSLLHAFAPRGQSSATACLCESQRTAMGSGEKDWVRPCLMHASRRAASLPVIGHAERRRIDSEGAQSLDWTLEGNCAMCADLIWVNAPRLDTLVL